MRAVDFNSLKIQPGSLVLPAWLPYVTISIAVVVAALWFLFPNPIEFPIDDTYIHFVYAENLAQTGKMIFNHPGEAGVGTTSLFWVLLLAGSIFLGVPAHIAAKIFGVAALVIVSIAIYSLLKTRWGAFVALSVAIIVSLSGNILWFALSGMETIVFLAFGALALLAYRAERWGWLGLFLGLTALTRPDGLMLAVAVGLVDLWRKKRLHSGLLKAALLTSLLVLPWYGYLLWRTGNILPTSAVGKQLSTNVGLGLVVENNPYLAFVQSFPGIAYPFLWLVFLLEFVFGGMALPGPSLPIGVVVGNPHYTLSLWALIIWVGVIAPLFYWAFRTLRKRPADQLKYIHDSPGWVLRAFLLWVVLHNLAYMFFLPIPGTASRYGAINHVLIWVALGLGLFSFIPRSTQWPFLAIGLIFLAGSNISYWNNVYDANIDHMTKVRIPAALYIRDQLSPEDYCAVFDVGALRYFGGRPVLDLGGLIDPELGERFLKRELDHYLIENGVTCLVLPGNLGDSQDGWFDFAVAFGFTTTPLFKIQPLTSFRIDYQRWLEGYLATNNYQSSVSIYHLNYSNP